MYSKIATHNSATGEKGKGFLSWLVTPFAKTQSKNIVQQYTAGCRSFDIRVKKIKGSWVCAHGLWRSNRSFESIICEIASFKDRCQVCVTYEGSAKYKDEFKEICRKFKIRFKHIIWGYIAVKYGTGSKGIFAKYDIIEKSQKGYEGGRQGFIALNGKSWHTIIPIPWLWKVIYNDDPVFNEEYFIYVDFL